MPAGGKDSLLVIVPCFNEEAAVGTVIQDVHRVLPNIPVLVIDDCSQDSTPVVARRSGAHVLSLPTHLGLGGCVQAGYKLAFELGYDYVIRVDGDGQHDANDIPNIFRTLKETGCQMVIGSRYLNGKPQFTSATRGLGIRLFRLILRPILGRWVLDPTSGFVGVNREALGVFGRSFPLEYPEIETLVVLKRKAFQFVEVPANVRPRRAGRSTITAMKSVYYIVHVLLGVFVNILKY